MFTTAGFLPEDDTAALAWNEDARRQAEALIDVGAKHAKKVSESRARASSALGAEALDVAAALRPDPRLLDAGREYAVDLAQRSVLFADLLRERGDMAEEYERSGSPPVLAFAHETVVDGATLERPVNYSLLRVLRPDGTTADPARRPYVIIDPRAGHGAGIGGSKGESQVGMAMAAGHPVYFVVFAPYPQPGQTLADVCAAEAEFVRIVQRLHPDAPKPIVVGNCQGGWGTMLLASSNPDITGPIVLNGAPMSYWAGRRGENPMRYLGGLYGGALPMMVMADLAGGKLDGANLVMNFERLNPGNTWWSKYYNAFANVDTERQRFLDFERWWTSFFFMNEEEIRWILHNLFVGNKLARGGARLDPYTTVDPRLVRSPIIVFASLGDNITPPQQALNWILDTYRSEHEIKVHGQRIVYLVHPDVGHLGIFVSSKVARQQHSQIVSTMKTIESLAPGLYELLIEDAREEGGEVVYTVSFAERTLEDLGKLDDTRADEAYFAPIARLSAVNEELYDIFARPVVRAMASPQLSEALVSHHPLRTRSKMWSSSTPGMAGLAQAAEMVRGSRHRASSDNPFVLAERLGAKVIEESWNAFRDLRDAWWELSFFSIWASPWHRRIGEPEQAYENLKRTLDLRSLPQVQLLLARIDEGGFVAGTIRIMLLLAHARGAVRQSRLDRANEVMTERKPFCDLTQGARSRVIREQSIIVDMCPEEAAAALPKLLPELDDRQRAMTIVEYVAGPREEMDAPTVEAINRVRSVLGLDGETPAAAQAAPRRKRAARKKATPATAGEES